MANGLRKYKIHPDVVFQPMDDEAIIVSLGSEDIYKLNLTGTEIVKLLEKAITVPDILDKLVEQFVVDKVDLTKEVNQLLEQLLAAGLIQEITEAA